MTIATHKRLLMGMCAFVADAMLAPFECPGAVLALVLATRAAPARNGSSVDSHCGQAVVGHTRGDTKLIVKKLGVKSKLKPW